MRILCARSHLDSSLKARVAITIVRDGLLNDDSYQLMGRAYGCVCITCALSPVRTGLSMPLRGDRVSI